MIWAHQSLMDWKCLYYSTASVLYYLGDMFGATVMKNQGDAVRVLSHSKFHHLMISLGYVLRKNQKQSPRVTINECRKDDFIVGQLCGNDGGTEHVIGMVDDLIFDSNNDVAIPLTDYSINRCCGIVGFKTFHHLDVYHKKYQETKARKRNKHQEQKKGINTSFIYPREN